MYNAGAPVFPLSSFAIRLSIESNLYVPSLIMITSPAFALSIAARISSEVETYLAFLNSESFFVLISVYAPEYERLFESYLPASEGTEGVSVSFVVASVAFVVASVAFVVASVAFVVASVAFVAGSVAFVEDSVAACPFSVTTTI